MKQFSDNQKSTWLRFIAELQDYPEIKKMTEKLSTQAVYRLAIAMFDFYIAENFSGQIRVSLGG